MPRRPKTGPLPNAPPRAIVTPEWARPVAARHPDFEEVLDLASVWLTLVFTEPHAVVFRELSRAARSEWSRLSETTDDALLVVFELIGGDPDQQDQLPSAGGRRRTSCLAPGIRECLEDPEYAWLASPAAALKDREAEFNRRIRTKAGAPRRNEHLRAMFEILRTSGHSYEAAVRKIAAAEKWRLIPESERSTSDAAHAATILHRVEESVTEHDVRRVERAIRPSRVGGRDRPNQQRDQGQQWDNQQLDPAAAQLDPAAAPQEEGDSPDEAVQSEQSQGLESGTSGFQPVGEEAQDAPPVASVPPADPPKAQRETAHSLDELEFDVNEG